VTDEEMLDLLSRRTNEPKDKKSIQNIEEMIKNRIDKEEKDEEDMKQIIKMAGKTMSYYFIGLMIFLAVTTIITFIILGSVTNEFNQVVKTINKGF
jgi:uncharacterized membrane protein YukC